MLALLRRDFSLGRLFGNRVSIKLWKWLWIRNHGAWPPKANRSSEFRGEKVEVEGNGVVMEVRDIRVLDRGELRFLELQIPSLFSFEMAAEVKEAENVNSGVEVMDELCLLAKMANWP